MVCPFYCYIMCKVILEHLVYHIFDMRKTMIKIFLYVNTGHDDCLDSLTVYRCDFNMVIIEKE
jgi:hypothetical protein